MNDFILIYITEISTKTYACTLIFRPSQNFFSRISSYLLCCTATVKLVLSVLYLQTMTKSYIHIILMFGFLEILNLFLFQSPKFTCLSQNRKLYCFYKSKSCYLFSIYLYSKNILQETTSFLQYILHGMFWHKPYVFLQK